MLGLEIWTKELALIGYLPMNLKMESFNNNNNHKTKSSTNLYIYATKIYS